MRLCFDIMIASKWYCDNIFVPSVKFFYSNYISMIKYQNYYILLLKYSLASFLKSSACEMPLDILLVFTSFSSDIFYQTFFYWKKIDMIK